MHLGFCGRADLVCLPQAGRPNLRGRNRIGIRSHLRAEHATSCSLANRMAQIGVPVMPAGEKLDTHQKALNLNLDPTKFGSFAEIGAGQEVARWFLAVGAASGTVAKTISAYDKEVSDDLYGPGVRYVSRER